MTTTGDFMVNRRGMLKLGLGATAALALTAAGCGNSGSGGGESADSAELRFTWWGNPTRDANTAKVIELYKTEAPNVTITPERGDWNGYWDKLATQVAGNDAPDIIQMDMAYIREYGGRGALLDLAEYKVDTSKFGPGTVDPGMIDGKLFGVNAGVNAPVVLANPDVFAKAGVEVPDDTKWTWDDLKAVAAEVTAKSPKGTYGSSSLASTDPALGAWLRQQGKELYTADSVAYEPAELTAWLDYNMGLLEAKAIPTPEEISEDSGKTLEQTAFALGKLGLAWVWSNQLNAFQEAIGKELKILRYPSIVGKASEVKLWYKASMFWSASSRTKNPEAVAKFVSFLSNSQTAGEAMLTERGVPPQLEVRKAIADKLTSSDKQVVAFIEQIEPELGTAPPPPPVGAGSFPNVLQRYAQDVMFKRMSTSDAAAKCIEEVKNNISAAS